MLQPFQESLDKTITKIKKIRFCCLIFKDNLYGKMKKTKEN